MKKTISRRKFVQLSALAGVAATVTLSSCKKKSFSPSENFYEAIVIGSGFGASVSALRLTQFGIKTLMLEMVKAYEINPSKNVFTSTLSPVGRSFWL